MSDANNATMGLSIDEYRKKEYPLFGYDPDKILPIIAAGVWGLALGYHIFLSQKMGAWRYWGAFVAGITLEFAGYAVRRMAANKPRGIDNLWPYAVTQLLVVIGPTLLAASIDAAYGRIINYVDRSLSPVKRAALIFVSLDVFSIILQSGGSGMITSDKPSTARLAKFMLIAGFVLQLIGFLAFELCAYIFYRRVQRAGISTAGWSRGLWALFIACIFLLIRTMFRTLEYVLAKHDINGPKGFLLTTEWLFYVLDTLMCLIASAILSFWHPSFYVPRNPEERLESLPTKQEMNQKIWSPPSQ